MNNLDFFKALDYENGLEVVTKIFKHFPLQYAATIGLDEKPQVRPIEFKFEKDGMLYFDVAKCYRSYAELIRKDYTKERAEQYQKEIDTFFTAGWRALLMF